MMVPAYQDLNSRVSVGTQPALDHGLPGPMPHGAGARERGLVRKPGGGRGEAKRSGGVCPLASNKAIFRPGK